MIEYIDDNSVFISIDTRSIFAKDKKGPKISKPLAAKARAYASGKPWQPWGTDNLRPVQLRNFLAQSPEAQVCLDVISSYTYASGIGVFDTSEVDGKKVKKPVYDLSQQAFLQQINAQNYAVKAITDYWEQGPFFTQLIPSLDRKSIANVRVMDSPFCRVGKWDEKALRVNKCFISGTWHYMPTDNYIDELPMTDMWNFDSDIQNGSDKRIMYKGCRYVPGEEFYPGQPWHAMADNGTLELAGKLPNIRKRMIDNAMIIKYHVRIDVTYWQAIYGEEWTKASPKEKRDIKQTFYKLIEEKLTGSANAFKSIFSEKTTDRDGKTLNLIEIEKVETDSGKDAAFWQDIMASTSLLFVGFALPPQLVGPVLSNSKSQGGGSDIAEGQNSLISRLKLHRANILEPLERVMRYNRLLKPTETIEFEDTLLTTLDKNPTGQQKVVN